MKLIKTTSLVIIFLLVAGFTCHANNGKIAYAKPIKAVKIDGKLDDWPKTFLKYNIALNQNQFPYTDTIDFGANFMVGYNLSTKSIYVAVEVVDDSHIVDADTYSSHLNQDAHLLYLDVQHSLKGSGVGFYALTNNSLRLVNSNLSWDSFINNSDLNNIEHAVKRTKNKTIYEWKIYLEDLLTINSTIGMDHVIIDMDEDDQHGEYSTIAWGSNGWKSSMQNNLGDIFILDPKVSEGKIKGSVGYDNPDVEAAPWGLQFISVENPKFWTQLPLRGDTNYSIDLPEGNYYVRTALTDTADKFGRYLKVKNPTDFIVTVEGNKITDVSKLVLETLDAPDFHNRKTGFLIEYNEAKKSEIDNFFLKVMDYYNIVGMSVGLIRDGKIVYTQSYGLKNLYSGEKVSSTTLFDAGSVTKSVFAVAVLKLYEEGIIDLDKPLFEYLPYPDIEHDERYKSITVRHVLSHQTGFPNWRNGQLNFINNPGTTFGYSGEGFEYLKMVVEHLTNKPISEILKNKVLTPFNLENAHFTSNKALLKDLSFGHYSGNLQIHAPEKENYVAYGLHTNALYFSNFMVGLLEEKDLKKETYNEMLTKQITIPTDWPQKGSGWDQGYGLGFQLKESPYGIVYGHGGRNGAFDCNYEIYKDLNAGYVFFTNSNSGQLIKNVVREFLITGNTQK